MKDEKTISKNIKDLEYNRLLNIENFFLIVSATIIISIVLSDNIPEGLTKWGLVMFFVLSIVLVLLYYGKKLDNKIKEIENL